MATFAGAIVEESDISELEASSSEKPLVKLIQQTAQSLANATNTDLTFGAGSTDIDTHGFHSETVNTARITPTVAGYYRCKMHLHMGTAGANYTQLVVGLSKNGTRVDPHMVTRPDPTTAANGTMAETMVACDGVSDYLTMTVNQTSGGSRDTGSASPFRSTFEVEFLRPLAS